MANRSAASANRAPAKLRCAIYTRKSSEEGLEQDFNSLERLTQWKSGSTMKLARLTYS
jgi:hypothetical protein